MGRSPVGRGGAAEDEVLALVRQHAGELLRFARRFSICADDAQDAYQRALEKLVRRMRTEPPHSVLSWLRTVLRHEALEVRAERERMLSRELLDDERHGGGELTDPAERVERFERLAHTAEALRGLKPQELTALVMRAEGLSYREICERTDWTYTRTNRAITEGRRALRRRLEAIESGAECERWLPLLSLFADGEATAKELAGLRPHLRACAGCRATLRGFHEAPRQIGALVPTDLLPAAVAAATGGSGSGIGRHLEALVHGVLDRASVSVIRVQGAIDALPGTKLAAVAASTVAVASGGAAIEQAATAGVDRPRTEHLAAARDAPSTTTAVAVPDASTAFATAPLVASGVSPAGDTASSSRAESSASSGSGEHGGEGEFAFEAALPSQPSFESTFEWDSRQPPRSPAASARTAREQPSDDVHDAAEKPEPTVAAASAPSSPPPPRPTEPPVFQAQQATPSQPPAAPAQPAEPVSEFGGF
jgi:RNA polymerase sigma factor (sigma-70 family)